LKKSRAFRITLIILFIVVAASIKVDISFSNNQENLFFFVFEACPSNNKRTAKIVWLEVSYLQSHVFWHLQD